MKNLRTKGLAAASLLFAAAAPASADLINGGFEQYELTGGTYAQFDTAIPGWYVLDGIGDIEVQNNVAGTPYEGEQFVELDSTQPTTIAQDVGTVAGQEYVLSFAFTARPGTDILLDNVMGVFWDGLEIFYEAAIDYTPNWAVYSFNVTATSGLTTLAFGDLSQNAQNSYGVYLDDVQLTKVPEPATLGLLGLALGGIALSRRRQAIQHRA